MKSATRPADDVGKHFGARRIEINMVGFGPIGSFPVGGGPEFYWRATSLTTDILRNVVTRFTDERRRHCVACADTCLPRYQELSFCQVAKMHALRLSI